MRQLLLIGGAGFPGRFLARALVSNPENYVVIADPLALGQPEYLPSEEYQNWNFVPCDVNRYEDLASLMFTQQFDYVFHLPYDRAGFANIPDPLAVLNGIKGVENVVKLSYKTGITRLIFADSPEVYQLSGVYSQPENLTFLRAQEAVRTSVEAYLQVYQQECGLDFTIFRFSHVFGPSQDHKSIISAFIRAALRQDKLIIHDDGQQKHTFCWVDDYVEVLIKGYCQAYSRNQIYNLRAEEAYTLPELARKVIELSTSDSDIDFRASLPDSQYRRRLNQSTLISDFIGRKAKTLGEVLPEMVDIERQYRAA